MRGLATEVVLPILIGAVIGMLVLPFVIRLMILFSQTSIGQAYFGLFNSIAGG